MFGKVSKSPSEMMGQSEAIVGLSAASNGADTGAVRAAPAAGITAASGQAAADVKLGLGSPLNGAASSDLARSIISADLKVIGDLHCDGDLQIDGTVEGDINSRSLTVGEGAHIEGSISAETARIWGHASGQVNATSVTIAKTAKVTGDIAYQTLAIEEGAVLDGRCRQTASPRKASAHADVSSLKDVQSNKSAKGNGVSTKSGTSGDKPVAA